MVELAQAEIIQIYRKRARINQGDFGSRAFDISYESGRTKIKNIELGRQMPTAADLKKMATLLQIPVSELIPRRQTSGEDRRKTDRDAYLARAVLEKFPGLDAYMDMLNHAARINDGELLIYLCVKIADILRDDRGFSKKVSR